MKRMLMTATLAVLAFGASAQTWPDKSVTLVVPFPPGGSTDQVARAVGPYLTDKLKQSFLVDNKAGATGTIGATFVKRAAPDGTTFLVTSLGPLVIVPHLVKGLQFDALKDFDHITVAVQSPNVLVVPVNSPHKSLADVVAWQPLDAAGCAFLDACAAGLPLQQAADQALATDPCADLGALLRSLLQAGALCGTVLPGEPV